MMRLGTLLISCILSVAGMTYVPRAGKSVRPEMSVLAVEGRDGYECRYVEFAVGKDADKYAKMHEDAKTYLVDNFMNEDGTFKPEKPVTRAEVAVMISRAMEAK